MNTTKRKSLPHDVPLWVDPHREIYFVSINCRERFHNQLALPETSICLFETVRHRQENFCWQRDFFEHRLRHDESRWQKANYILENPVRKKLVARPEEWPFVYYADGQRPQFNW
jgi:hypothetical protein